MVSQWSDCVPLHPPPPPRLPVRGPDKLELSQAVGSALQRDQRQPRLWEQLGHLYEQDGPKPDDPARSYPGPARPHNGYAAGPGPGGHFAPRPNQLLRVRDETRGWREGGEGMEYRGPPPGRMRRRRFP